MDFIIEIGEPHQQEAVKYELSFLAGMVKKFDTDLNLKLIVLARDFDKTVNELEKKSGYKSQRGLGDTQIKAIARVVHLNDGYGIVLSPLLYMEGQDTSTRYFTLFHEFLHVVNRNKYEELDPEWRDDWLGRSNYKGNLYRLWDEYSADSFAYEFVDEAFEEKSIIWVEMIDNSVEGFLSLLTDDTYYNMIRSELDFCRTGRRDLQEFLRNIYQGFDEVVGITVHAFALLHQYPDLISIDQLTESKFINEKTIRLMDFYRACSHDLDMELKDGLHLVADYISNFGYTMVDQTDGTHVQIVDI